MKRLKAFAAALVIFLCITGGIRMVVMHSGVHSSSREFRYWYNPYKDKSAPALQEALGKNTMVIFGSSELGHSRKSPYYIKNMFSEKALDAMLIGQPYSQDMNHATTLAALAPYMKSRKVVLLLSPTWFMGKDTSPENFSIRYSDSAYIGMLRNPDISPALKRSMAQRTRHLLRNDKAALSRVKAYDAVYLNDTRDPFTRLKARYYQNHTMLQERAALLMAEQYRRISDPGTGASGAPGLPGKSGNAEPARLHSSGLRSSGPIVSPGTTPDWQALQDKALTSAERKINNPLMMQDKIWKTRFRSKYRSSVKLHAGTETTVSGEYGDLELFLQVCKEENIKPLLIIQPVNGFWYDHSGLKAPARDGYRAKIKDVASRYDAQVTDLSQYDYEPGVLTDAVHPWGKGWVILDEVIYNYYKAP